MNTLDDILETYGVAVVIKDSKEDGDYRFLGIAELSTSFETGEPQNHAEAIGRAVLANFKD